APGARRGHPQRHRHGRRRVRHLHRHHHRGRAAGGQDLLQREQSHGPLHSAEARRVAVSWSMRIWMPGVALCLAVGLLVSSVATAQQNPIANSSWPNERPPAPLPAREVKFPPYEIRTLANGMRVLAILHHEQPVVTMRLLIGAGAAEDPQGKAGLANLLGNLLDQGTSTRTAQEIADQIDTIGGALGTGSGSD